MRLLFISSTFPDAGSPARGTYNGALCCALAEEHQVYALAPRPYPEALRTLTRFKSYRPLKQFVDCGITADYPTYWYTPKFFRTSYGKQMWWSVRRRVRQVIKTFRPDAVLSYWAHPEGEVGLLAAREAGIPSAVIVGGTDVLLLPHEPGRGEVIRRVLTSSSAVIGISEGLRQAALGLGVSPDRAHTIYQGIDPQVFCIQDRDEARRKLGLPLNQRILLWVGRMVPIKGLGELIAAFKDLLKHQPNSSLCLVGDGPSRHEIEAHVRSAGLEKSVRFCGSVRHDELANWYRAADLFVMASHSEGLPNVLREALACGTPFVSTDVGSVREIADERYSRLVPVNSPPALTRAMLTMSNPKFRQAAENYKPRTWKRCALELAAVLENEIERRKQTPDTAVSTTRQREICLSKS